MSNTSVTDNLAANLAERHGHAELAREILDYREVGR